MKTLSIFEIQDINTLLKEKHFDYVLKLKDVCGNQAVTLECVGTQTDTQSVCNTINIYLKTKHKQVKLGSINPLQLQVL